MRLDLNQLLRAAGYNPEDVLVFRHRPSESRLAKVLPWLAVEHADLFNAYQRYQTPQVEAAMSKARHVAAFIGLAPATATFVGLCAINGAETLKRADYAGQAEIRALMDYGMSGWPVNDAREQILRFDLAPTNFYTDWHGRLTIDWPPPERSWWRRAHRGTMPVRSIVEDSSFVKPLDDWRDLVLTWNELSLMPQRLQDQLREWRGVYVIHDTSDHLNYIGSAGGEENILGRWRNYAVTGHGGNVLLRQRDPTTFTFAVLQRTSPDLPLSELVVIEDSWKSRLKTRFPGGLNNN